MDKLSYMGRQTLFWYSKPHVQARIQNLCKVEDSARFLSLWFLPSLYFKTKQSLIICLWHVSAREENDMWKMPSLFCRRDKPGTMASLLCLLCDRRPPCQALKREARTSMAAALGAEQEPTPSVGTGSPTMDLSSGEAAWGSLRLFVSVFWVRQGNSTKWVDRLWTWKARGQLRSLLCFCSSQWPRWIGLKRWVGGTEDRIVHILKNHSIKNKPTPLWLLLFQKITQKGQIISWHMEAFS